MERRDRVFALILNSILKVEWSAMGTLGSGSNSELGDESFLPVLDTRPLQILAEQAGDAVAQGFLEDYLKMLPGRSAKILRALAADDAEATLDAVISLKVSSATAGALRLAEYARQLQRQLALRPGADTEKVQALLLEYTQMFVHEARQQLGFTAKA